MYYLQLPIFRKNVAQKLLTRELVRQNHSVKLNHAQLYLDKWSFSREKKFVSCFAISRNTKSKFGKHFSNFVQKEMILIDLKNSINKLFHFGKNRLSNPNGF